MAVLLLLFVQLLQILNVGVFISYLQMFLTSVIFVRLSSFYWKNASKTT